MSVLSSCKDIEESDIGRPIVFMANIGLLSDKIKPVLFAAESGRSSRQVGGDELDDWHPTEAFAKVDSLASLFA